jgi:integrase
MQQTAAPRASAVVRPTMTTWNADQVRAFLDHTAEHRLHAAFVMLATNRMRRGECLGLRWSDVDLTPGRVSISQTVIMVDQDIQFGSPKTSRGRRTVAVDPETVAALREHRRRQLAERMLMGAGFTDHGLVSCRPRRRAAAPRTVLSYVLARVGACRVASDPAARFAARVGHACIVRR